MAERILPSRARPWYLHAARSNGAHAWWPFSTWAEFVWLVENAVPVTPDDVVWNVTWDTLA